MTPERLMLGALTLAVAALAYQVRNIVVDDEGDREYWYRAMQEWAATR